MRRRAVPLLIIALLSAVLSAVPRPAPARAAAGPSTLGGPAVAIESRMGVPGQFLSDPNQDTRTVGVQISSNQPFDWVQPSSSITGADEANRYESTSYATMAAAGTFTAYPCRVGVWLQGVSATTGQLDPTALYADPCAPATAPTSVPVMVSDARWFGFPVVVVNTVIGSTCGVQVFPAVADQVAPLGLSPQIGQLDLCHTTFTAVTNVGSSAGAWEQAEPGTADLVPASSAALAPMFGSIHGVVANNGAAWQFTSFMTTPVKRYGGDGRGGWQVGSVQYPFGYYAPDRSNAPVPPAGRGGMQLVVANDSLAGEQVLLNRTYWTNTGTATADTAAWSALAADINSWGTHPGVLLLRNVGSAKVAAAADANDPSLQAAWAVDRLWGIYDAIAGLRLNANLTMIIPGGITRNVSSVIPWQIANQNAAIRVPPGLGQTVAPDQVPVTYGTWVTPKADARYAQALLAHTRTGNGYTVATSTTESSDTATPFAFQQVLAQPAGFWPNDLDPGLADLALQDWSHLLCSCADVRSLYVTGTGMAGWPAVIAANLSSPRDGLPLSTWQSMGTELSTEAGWVQNVWNYWQHMTGVNSYLTAASTGELQSVIATVQASLKTDANLDITAGNANAVGPAIATSLIIAPTELGALGFVMTGALAAWDYALVLSTSVPAGDAYYSGTLSQLSGTVTRRAADTLTALGVEFQAILGDYAKLKAVGTALGSATYGSYWYTTQDSEPGEAKALASTAKAGMYRAVLPAIYEEMVTADGNGGLNTDWGNQMIDLVDHIHTFAHYAGSQAYLAVPGPRQHVGLDVGQFLAPGDWYVAAIGRTPMFDKDTSKPDPPSAALLSDIEATGVPLVEILRQWPLRHMNVATGQEHYQWFTCWNAPALCYPGL